MAGFWPLWLERWKSFRRRHEQYGRQGNLCFGCPLGCLSYFEPQKRLSNVPRRQWKFWNGNEIIFHQKNQNRPSWGDFDFD